MKHKFGLLPKVLLAIALGIVFGLFVPEWFTRIALTFNNIFGNFLNFVIPLLILGLVAPGIADLGSKAGRAAGNHRSPGLCLYPVFGIRNFLHKFRDITPAIGRYGDERPGRNRRNTPGNRSSRSKCPR